jgi:hypothetical protein
MSVRVTAPPISIARELWRYGEPQLAAAALRISLRDALRISVRAGELFLSGTADRVWADGPQTMRRPLLVAAIEHLEGAARPPSRRRRLPERSLPPELQATEEERWNALGEMSRLESELFARGEQP